MLRKMIIAAAAVIAIGSAALVWPDSVSAQGFSGGGFSDRGKSAAGSRNRMGGSMHPGRPGMSRPGRPDGRPGSKVSRRKASTPYCPYGKKADGTCWVRCKYSICL